MPLLLADEARDPCRYPMDTIRRRMMMTSGEAVKYKSSLDAFAQIIKQEGTPALFRGACEWGQWEWRFHVR